MLDYEKNCYLCGGVGYIHKPLMGALWCGSESETDVGRRSCPACEVSRIQVESD